MQLWNSQSRTRRNVLVACFFIFAILITRSQSARSGSKLYAESTASAAEWGVLPRHNGNTKERALPGVLELRVTRNGDSEPNGFSIRYHFVSNQLLHVYNPFLSRLIPSATNFAVFDSAGEHLGYLNSKRTAGSSRSVSPSDWVCLSVGCLVGRDFFWDGKTYYGQNGEKINPLVPGKYYVQMIASELLTFPPPTIDGLITEDAEQEWRTRQRVMDYIRSNSVEIEVK